MRERSVCIMGLGTVGLPKALHFSDQGCEVTGYDLSRSAVEKASAFIKATNDPAEIPNDTEYFIICVSTTQMNGRPNAYNVYDSCQKILDFHPKLVSVESTVPIGTCRDIHGSILKRRLSIAHVPHRYWPEDPFRYGVRQPRVLGGIDRTSMREAKEFYLDAGIPLHEVEPIEIAEMAKIAENSYRYVQIAFAEELRLICQENNLDFFKLRRACNSKWNVSMLEARDGIGGTCLPKDIWYLITAAEDRGVSPDLLLSAVRADKKYRNGLLRQLVHA